MATVDMIERWKIILAQVKKEETGKSDAFARSLGISKVTLYKDIRLINALIGAGLFLEVEKPIKYSRRQGSYVFEKPFIPPSDR